MPDKAWKGGVHNLRLTDFCHFLTTHLPLIYIRLHLANHLPIVNIYTQNWTTPTQYAPLFTRLKEVIRIHFVTRFSFIQNYIFLQDKHYMFLFSIGIGNANKWWLKFSNTGIFTLSSALYWLLKTFSCKRHESKYFQNPIDFENPIFFVYQIKVVWVLLRLFENFDAP